MKKIFVLVTGIVLMLVQSACVNSLHPVATVKTIITDKRLSGEWMDGKEGLRIQLLTESDLFKEKDGSKLKLGLGDTEEAAFISKTYAITVAQKGIDYVMIGSLSRINDQLFVDIMPLGIKNPKEEGTSFNYLSSFSIAKVDYLYTFNIVKIEFENDNKLVIKYLNGEFIKEQVSKGNLRLKYERDNLFDSFLITASSFELRQFLEKYGDDERLYYKEDKSTILTRKG